MHYLEYFATSSAEMDGNLLDPETADETLAKDWNLPELPEGVQYNINKPAKKCAGRQSF